MTTSITTEMMIKEIMWENHQIDEGVRKYRESSEGKGLAETTGGQRLLKSAMPNTIKGIEEAFAVTEALVLDTVHGHRADNWVYMIALLSAEQGAVIALNHMLEHCQTSHTSKRAVTLTYLAKKIGNTLNQQVKFENWKAVEKEKQGEHNATCKKGKEMNKSFAQILISRAKGQVNRQKLVRWEKKFDTYRNIDWGQDCLNIGAKMLELVAAANPDLFTMGTSHEKNKTTRTLIMTDEAWSQYEQIEETAELQRPLLLPTLIPPVAWAYVSGKVQGGYHHISSDLFTRGNNAHTAGDSSASSQKFLDSVNSVQATAWRINPYTLMVVDMINGTGSTTGGVTQNTTMVTPTMKAESYEKLTKEEKKAYHAKRNTVVEEIASARGRHSAFTRKLSIAHKMAQHSEFYFPHFADFRGRLYPMPSELTPQGDQIAKGLLMFAEGRKLGESGLKWLMIHAANTFGMDKETLANREQWALDNLDLLARVSSDPITHDCWSGADEPLTFLAAAREITAAMELEDPKEFLSHLPVAMDGTCNGMQILSMMGRDATGAEATNCTSEDHRHDLYVTVATSVMGILKADAAECPISAEWFARLDGKPSKSRKVVKRAVMTVPYGVTDKGIATQLVSDRHCVDFNSGNADEAAQVMTKAILLAMSSVNGKAVEIMSYFQSVATELAKAGSDITWYTPMGLKVTQAYNRTNKKEVMTVLGKVILQVEDKKLGLDGAGQSRSIAPNVIHSFDAAMLQLTVSKMAEAGHTAFAMIHDSYGMHPSLVEDLHVALRSAALEIFSVDCLAEFHEHAQSLTDETLSTPPTLGDYDINEILNAPYFFS